MDKSYSDCIKEISKKFGDRIVNIGVNKAAKTLFSLGSPSLDFCTYNSIPEGIFIEITGGEGSGKTLLR